MAGDREELESLRRLAELEARASAAPKPEAAQAPSPPRSVLQRALGLNRPPLTPEQQQAIEKVKDYGNLGPAADKVGGFVADQLAATGHSPNISAGGGYAANVLVQAIPTAFGFRTAPKEVSGTEGLAKWLMNKAVKPSTEDVVNKSADKAFGTMLRERQLPTQGGMVKAQQIVNEMHPEVQAGIKASPAEIPIEPMEQGFLGQYEKALPQGAAAVKEVGDVWKNFSQSGLIAGSPTMSAEMADLMKRGAQTNARANYGKPTGEAEKAMAALIREELLKGVPSIRAPLAREAENMNVLDVARNSIAQSSKANPAGLGALRADDALPMLGFLADRSPLIKGLLAHMIYQGGRPEVAIPAGTAASRIPELFKQE